MNIKPIGEVRQSQALTTFGIGAVVDFRFHSVMPLGLEYWPSKKECQTIHEPDLERILEKRWFQAPPIESPGGWIPFLKATRFPRYMFCPKCNAIGLVQEFNANRPNQNNEDMGYYSFRSDEDQRCKCLRINQGQCNGVGVPTRLVAVCYHEGEGGESEHKGHIEDFPWYLWAHKGKKDWGNGPHYLKLKASNRTLAIEDLVVSCTCGASESLKGVFSKDILRGIKKCRGWRPWLESYSGDKPPCDRPLKVFLRGATNLHIPVTTSVISIPPYSNKVHQDLSDFIDDLDSQWEEKCEDAAEQGLAPPSLHKFATRKLEKIRDKGFDRLKENDDLDVIESIVDRLGGGAQ